jgi:hypothetical protein
MAYGQQDYGMGAEYGYETEEERRRREEEERQREIEMMANTGMGAAAPAGAPASRSLGDIAGAYMNKRVDQAQQRVADVGEMFTDPQAALEKRLGMTGGAVDTEPTPVKQTITTDPTTGEQKMKIEGSVRDLSAANPLTPTVSGPAVPTAMPPAAEPQAAPQQTAPQAQAQPMARPTPVPAQLPAAGPIDPNAPRPDIGQVPTPGPGVQVAGAPGAPMPAVPVAPTTMAAAPAGGQTPAAVADASGASVAQIAEARADTTPEQRQQQAVIDAKNEKDPARRRQMFAQLIADQSVSEGTKTLANRFMAEEYMKQQDVAQANRKIEEATPTDLARYMREQKKEGSYVKAILLSRLGLNRLADQEMELINPTLSMTNMVDDKGNRYSVETDKNGKIRRAFDTNGKSAGQEEIAKLQAAGGTLKGVEVEAGIFKDPTGGVSGSFVLERRPGGSQYREVGSNRIATSEESAKLIKTGVQGTLANQRDRALQELNIKLQGKTEEEKMVILRPYNQQLVAAGFAAIDPREVSITAPQVGGAPAAAPGGAAPAPAAAPAGDPVAAQRAQADIDGLQREIVRAQKGTGVSDSAKAGQLQVLNAELKNAQQRFAQASGTGGVTAAPVATTGPRPTGPELALQASGATKAQGANIDIATQERTKFLDYAEKDITPKADAGGTISGIRKQQLKGPDGILNNPEIVGMLSGQGGTVAEVGNIIRDLVTGARTDEELSTRVASLGLNQRQKDVLMNQIALNRQVAPFTLKQNAGPGSVSDAEQKANREAAVNIARVPLYTAVTMLSKDQFDKDLSVAREAFRTQNRELTTTDSFNAAWNKEKARLSREYDQIYADRAKYIGKYYQDGANPKAITEAYKHYPVPEYNRETGSWNYGTDFARKSARPRLDSFNR